ncbi:hypothetical protein VKT23_020275 [Stygiomarasmius scandens]|uniref:F-box associated domain-containing protein n=1 Tax=Marasmiellus scandens TaxID=2682957 RepID=A0ABR1IM09_9AGAR
MGRYHNSSEGKPREIHDSYDNPRDRADVCMRSVDELSWPLGNGEVQVATRYILDRNSSGTTFAVDIDFIEISDIRRNFVNTLPVPKICGLHVNIENAEPWLKVESMPKTLLNTAMSPHLGYVAFNDEKTSGRLMFCSPTDDSEVFSVELELREGKPWAEIYSPDFGFWRLSSRIQWIIMGWGNGGTFALVRGFDIRVRVTKLEEFNGPASRPITYVVTISISRRGDRAARQRRRRRRSILTELSQEQSYTELIAMQA